MDSSLSRRSLLQILGAAGLVSSAPFRSPAAAASKFSRMPAEGKDTPKICLGYPAEDAAGMRRLKQIGVDNVLMGGPGFRGRKPTSAPGSNGSSPAG